MYHLNGPALATAPAIDLASYDSVAIGTTVSQAIQKLGTPMSRNALKSFIGGLPFLTSLVKSQPTSDSCAYYLQAHNRTTRAYQFCFNSAQSLVAKAIISTSGSAASTATGG